MTASSNCSNAPAFTTETWTLLGIFLVLAMLSPVLVRLIFHGIGGAVRRHSLFLTFQKSFLFPVTFLTCLLFIYLAESVIPWSCKSIVIDNIIVFIIAVLAFAMLIVLIIRVFRFLEKIIRYFKVRPFYFFALIEGLRVGRVITLILLGLYFFTIVLGKLNSNSFGGNFFTMNLNIFSIIFALIMIPMLRDGVGGISCLADVYFDLGDYIEIDGTNGIIDRIGLFQTCIRTLDGTYAMVPNSRFVDTQFLIYRAKRKRVVEFQFPLFSRRNQMFRYYVGDDRRNLVHKIETTLHFQGFKQLSVQYVENLQGDYLNIGFTSESVKSIDTQVREMNSALLEVVKSLD